MIKVASCSDDYHLEKVSTGLPIIISTGGLLIEDIDASKFLHKGSLQLCIVYQSIQHLVKVAN